MSGIPYDEYNGWRKKFIQTLMPNSCTYQTIKVINPVVFFDIGEPEHDTKEIVRWELRTVKDSNIVVANLDKINSSVGSVFEIAEAYHNNIPIIGLNETNYQPHPWIDECVDHVEKSMENLVEYLNEYYLCVF